MRRPLLVSVVGAGRASREEYSTARTLGRELTLRGAVVVCGGRGGVMEAVARGVAEAGGVTVGVLPGDDAKAANAWVTIPLPTGLGAARNALVAGAADVVLAVGGSWGTLSEIAHARVRGVRVGVLLSPPVSGLDLPWFSEPAEAARWAAAGQESGDGRGSGEGAPRARLRLVAGPLGVAAKPRRPGGVT